MSFLVEKGIEPLVRALNELDFAATVYSCEGHFDAEQREMFLPTAYVTFDVSDVGEFRGLYERLRAFDGSARAARLRLTYDCILGRYTLSIWPDVSIESPRHKRENVDAAVVLLSDIVVDYARPGTRAGTAACTYSGLGGAPVNPGQSFPPCQLSDSLSVPPCTLVIPPKEFICPFVKPEEGLESQR